MIGEDILNYVKGLRDRLEFLERHTEFWELPVTGGTLEILFLPQMDPPLDDPSMGMDRLVQRRGKLGKVAGLVYPDRRGKGYGLSRFRDDQRLDFTRIAKEPEVHFAHSRGFVAKTSATENFRLKELLTAALTGPRVS